MEKGLSFVQLSGALALAFVLFSETEGLTPHSSWHGLSWFTGEGGAAYGV